MPVRRIETFPPVTMGHIRGHGCRDLLVYCSSGHCHHSATMSAQMSGRIGRRVACLATGVAAACSYGHVRSR